MIEKGNQQEADHRKSLVEIAIIQCFLPALSAGRLGSFNQWLTSVNTELDASALNVVLPRVYHVLRLPNS